MNLKKTKLAGQTRKNIETQKYIKNKKLWKD